MTESSSVHVLLTGGAGYIGSHMLLKLLDAGYRVTVVDDLSSGFSERIPEGVTFYNIDLKDKIALQQVFQQKKIDIVMHFAASIIISESLIHPEKHYTNNFISTLSLLEVMKMNQVNKIIFSSTSAIFGEPKYLPVDEKHPCNPISAYGKSKLMCEFAFRDYDVAYGIKSVCLRYFNAAGADPDCRTGFDKYDMHHILPVALLVALEEQDSIKIYGVDFDTPDGTGLRDYVHVYDLCDAHLLSMKHLLSGGDSRAYNLGNGDGCTVRQLINTVENVTGKKLKQIDAKKRQGDPEALVSDSTRIKNELGWKPKYDIESIVKHSWAWVSSSVKVA